MEFYSNRPGLIGPGSGGGWWLVSLLVGALFVYGRSLDAPLIPFDKAVAK